MELLDCPVQPYAWGSRTAIAGLQGRDTPSDGPEAELWIGAHPSAPSTLPDGGSLLDRIGADPERELGADAVARFGPTLPFLLKVIAAERPLSLQAHPTRAQAEAGFAADDARGIALDAPERHYRDPWPKPELVVALTPFTALCGFRQPAVSAELIEALAVPALSAYAGLLRTRGAGALREVFTALIHWPVPDRPALVEAVGAAAQRRGLAWLAGLARDFPGDPGVACATLLNVVELAPGEAIHLPAGNLHAYLRGTAVEIMANSDNVLRCGLTSKHVDPDALLDILDVRATDVAVLHPRREGREEVYPVAVPEFRLARIAVAGDPIALDRRGAQLLLCVEGAVTAGGVTLLPGCAAYGAAADEAITLTGRGVVFRATAGASEGSMTA